MNKVIILAFAIASVASATGQSVEQDNNEQPTVGLTTYGPFDNFDARPRLRQGESRRDPLGDPRRDRAVGGQPAAGRGQHRPRLIRRAGF
jgi:hypothetical protein